MFHLKSTIIMIKNILITTDFSERSKDVLPFVKTLQKRFNAKIHYIHIIPDSPFIPSGPGTLVTANRAMELQQEAIDKKKERSVERMIETLSDYLTGNYSAKCLQGDFTNVLKKYTIENEIDFCLIATEGENSIEDKIFGTHAVHLIRNLNCPVLTLPYKYKKEGFKKILIAFDLLEEDITYLIFVAYLANCFKGSIEILLVEPENYLFIEDDIKHLKKIIASLRSANINYKVKVNDNIVDAIYEEAEKIDADLLVLKTHTESVFDRIFHRSTVVEAQNRIQLPILNFNTHFQL